MRTAATLAGTLLVCVSSVQAHHSSSMFDLSKPIWLEGTVVSYTPINPHTRIVIEQRGEDGRVQRWTVEGPSRSGSSPNSLERRGVSADFLKPGDVIEVCGFAPTRDTLARVPTDNHSRYPNAFVHGHVLVMPSTGMQIWGSYGKLENCVRSSDEAQTWIDFVNADERAHGMWCHSRHVVNIASVAPAAMVEAIDRLKTTPCR